MDKNEEEKDSKNSVTVEDVLCKWYIWIPIGYASGDQLGGSSTYAAIGLVIGAAFGWLLQGYHNKKAK